MNKIIFCVMLIIPVFCQAQEHQPNVPIAPRTFSERASQTWSAYRRCRAQFYLKEAECNMKSTEQVRKDGQCTYTAHMERYASCWKEYGQTMTKEVFEHFKS